MLAESAVLVAVLLVAILSVHIPRAHYRKIAVMGSRFIG